MKKIFNMLMATAIALCTFTACEDVPMPFNNPLDYQENETDTSIPPEGDGTFENPFNVSAVLQYIDGLEPGVESDKDVYVKGVVLSVKEQFGTEFGNATFTMSDDDEGTNSFTFFRGLYFGNKKYSNTEDVNVVEGDKVVVCGRVMNYGGNTPETAQGKAFIVTINDKTVKPKETTNAEPKGTGTQTDPYNVAGVLAYINTLGADKESPEQVYIKGKVKEVKEQFGTQFGNAWFTMVDEGYDTEFTAYRVLYLGNKKYTSGTTIKEGDDVIVCGKVVNYKGNTPETVQNTGYLYSLNGTTEGGGGGGDTPPAPEAKGDGTEANPYNPAGAINAANALPADGESGEVYVEGIISTIKEINTNYGNGTYYISEDGKANNEFYIYRGKYLNNENFTSNDQIKVGDKVLLKGKLLNYRGNTPEFAQGNYIVKLTPGEGGGDNPGGGGEVSGNSITVSMSSFGLSNAEDAGTLTLSDGTTLTFAGGENTSNTPKYYTSGSAIRVYAKNTLTIKASKAITKVVITCANPQSGTVYNGNDMMYGEAGGKRVTTSKDSDTQVTFSGFSNSTLFICNDHTEAKAGTQLRIVTMVITYAE